MMATRKNRRKPDSTTARPLWDTLLTRPSRVLFDSGARWAPPRRNHLPHRLPSRVAVLGAFSLMVLSSCAGCPRTAPPPAPEPMPFSQVNTPQRVDQFDVANALELLKHFDEYNQDRVSLQIIKVLDMWAEGLEADAEWSPDPLLQKLPPELRKRKQLDGLAALRFTLGDLNYLRQCNWLSEIARWSTREDSPSDFVEWLEQQPLDAFEKQQLQQSERLFDWTVCHLQLDSLREYPKDAAAGPLNKPNVSPERPRTGPERALPGPGYVYEPWQVLMYGHGDAWQRARVFIQLCRQQRIPAFMIGLRSNAQRPRSTPWAVGVLIGERIYVFDTQLGLPLPGDDERGIVTLSELKQNPSLLRRLDIDDQRPYDIQESDLNGLVALLDASHFALSQRMQRLDRAWVGEELIALSASPSDVAEHLREHDEIVSVRLWEIPFEVFVFQEAYGKAAQRHQQLAFNLFLESAPFQSQTPLAMARELHFRRQLDATDDSEGAKQYYMQARIPQSTIEKIGTSSETREQIGLGRSSENETDEAYRARLRLSQQMYLIAKAHATYWLGLAHYDNGKYEVAANWLQTQVLDAEHESPWRHAASYTIARSYEALGDLQTARDIYLRDDSAQRQGCILRARMLKKKIDAAESGTSEAN